MSERDLYVAFSEVLSLSQSTKDDLAGLLDPETGFAPRMRQLCREQIQHMEDTNAPPEDLEIIRLEENTWNLLQAVLPARKTELPPTPSAQELLSLNPYTPPSSLAQAIMQSSRLLAELVVVREWLHDTAPSPPVPDATTGYWKYTKHTVLQGMRSGGAYRDGLVRELDPDAPNREEGRALASDDASGEKVLLQALYACVRAGRLEDAVELCRRAHQPWRASSILGSRLFRWPALSTEPREEDSDAMVEDDAEAWHGNQNRKLWKKTCVHAALNNALSDQERLLYASLTPSPLTATILKSACRTWEDHLWVQISIICEEKESLELGRLGGSFWEGGAVPDEDQEEEEWKAEVEATLKTLEDVAVTEGPDSGHAFHFAQLRIILDETDELLEKFAGILTANVQKQTFEYGQLCRFFAHLCLYLQLIDIPTPPHATQVVLESYLRVLEDAEQRQLIAMYAGALGDNAVDRYAHFLVSLGLTADISERKLALTQADDHGLDRNRVAIAAAERTIDAAFDELDEPKGPLPSVVTAPQPPSEEEEVLLRSIEWTTFFEQTYDVALEQTNVILRYFLAVGKVQAALSLLEMLPAGLADISLPEERATEYLHYRQFFVIWETLERVVEHQGQAVDVARMGKEEKAQWLGRYRSAIEQSHEQITVLLTSEWLTPCLERGSVDRRKRDLIRIRQIYIPEITIRLHFALVDSRQWIPENLRRAMELVNIVADSRYRLYDDFISGTGVAGNNGRRRLGEYLGAVRQAFVAGLEKGGSDPFRTITSAASM
ncbi:hypothetical protein FA13DRAFT_1820574 [Coprinellus micaceus]|uniref:Nuclear pore complex protein n=1 Tax=Coprinellus micaceus TaxID=71717 RepID=A0A4Y7SDT3_COPMI|nr:hypothetical protein FA13DRAFT_1820574 [Coprinellus micaceus]